MGSVGTLHALGLAREKGARFVLASTSEVYGDPLEHPQRETYWGNVNPVGPRSVYDEAKRFAESLTTAYRHSRGTDTGIVRIFNTYGPRMRPLTAGRSRRSSGSRCSANRSPSPATAPRPAPSATSTTPSGILAMAASDFAGPVNIGNSGELTMLELAALIRELSGSSSPIEFIDRPADDPRVRARHRWQQRLGWRAGCRPPTGCGGPSTGSRRSSAATTS